MPSRHDQTDSSRPFASLSQPIVVGEGISGPQATFTCHAAIFDRSNIRSRVSSAERQLRSVHFLRTRADFSSRCLTLIKYDENIYRHI